MSVALTAAPRLVRSVLHATDFSPATHFAFAHALGLALRRGTRFTILHVATEGHRVWAAFPPVQEMLARWRLQSAGIGRSALGDGAAIRVAKVAVDARVPAAAIAGYLERHPHELLVLATGGQRGIFGRFGRSGAAQLARAARTPTLLVPADAERCLVSLDGRLSLDSILVVVMPGADPRPGLDVARRVAESLGARRVAIVALELGRQQADGGDAIEAGAAWTLRHQACPGRTAEAIRHSARAVGANLIVMPAGGRAALLDRIRGPLAERVVRRAACPVLIVPAYRRGAVLR